MSVDTTQTVQLGNGPGSGPVLRPLDRGASVGRYVILETVGSGGMGIVYAAYDPELDRKVALKLVRPDRFRQASRLRLLREAQAVARLSHPNVVAVHDAGTWASLDGDQVYVAMELVQGRTLRQWLQAAPRSWREVLAVLLDAGRGLAAAHAAGLVHRDFKPDNVLIGDDGRVRVADFGLVLRAEDSKEEGDPSGAMGTPSYMAPESLRGEPADARTDQYGFCVTVWEALHGERPFDEEGRLRDAPVDRRVPWRLRQALQRGLSSDPGGRFPSMDELLAVLDLDRTMSRWRWLSLAAMALAAFTLLIGWERREERLQLCRGAEGKLAGIWDAERKQDIRQAFVATKVSYAAGAWTAVERALDQHTGRWATMHRETCEATRLRGEQSEDLLDRRMFCLEQRRREVEALVQVFSRADALTVERAASATAALPGLEECADTAALTSRVPPPADPQVQARVEALTQSLARARALGAAGKYRDGLTIARQAAAEAEKVPYPPIAAETLLLRGNLEDRAGEPDSAAATLLAAVALAEAAAVDEVKARAAIARLRVLGKTLGRFEEAHEWEALAAAAVERLDGDERLTAEYLHELGQVYESEGRYPDAQVQLLRALEIRRRLGVPAPELAATLGEYGVTLFRLGRYPEARQIFEEALALQRDTVGPEHPDLAGSLNRIGNTFYAQGHYQEALSYLRQGLALREAALGPVHRLVADSLVNLGNTLDRLGRYEEAIASYRRAYAIQVQVFGPVHPDLAMSLDNTGSVYANQRRWKEAESFHRQALEMRMKTVGRENPRTALTLHNLGNVCNLQGRYEEALLFLLEALAIEERTLGADHPTVAEEITAIADIERRLGRHQAALRRLERALRMIENLELEPGITARTHFALAEAIWDTGGSRERAVQLARRARADLAPFADDEGALLADIDHWLARAEKP